MTYRPTVRYPDIYKDYIEELYQATDLDRNQIIRLALFVAAHSKAFKDILEKHKSADVPLPHPHWGIHEQGCWRDQNYSKKTDQRDSIKISEQGGIKFTVG